MPWKWRRARTRFRKSESPSYKDWCGRLRWPRKWEESREFATHVQGKVWKTQAVLNRKVADRGVKKAPFVVLIGANMPSVLAEIAFLSNPAEEKALEDGIASTEDRRGALCGHPGLCRDAERRQSRRVLASSYLLSIQLNKSKGSGKGTGNGPGPTSLALFRKKASEVCTLRKIIRS